MQNISLVDSIGLFPRLNNNNKAFILQKIKIHISFVASKGKQIERKKIYLIYYMANSYLKTKRLIKERLKRILLILGLQQVALLRQ